MKDTYRNLFNTYGNTKAYRNAVEFVNRLHEQEKNLDPNKKYILDPFVGYIEKK